MVVLNLARFLRMWNEIEILILCKTGGPLAGEFAAIAQTIVLGQDVNFPDPSWQLTSLLDAGLKDRVVAALCNTILTSDLILPFRRFGIPVISLVHELPTTIRMFGIDTIRTIDREAEAIVYGSKFVRDRVTAAFECRNAKQEVIPTGYPRSSRTPSRIRQSREILRAECKISANAFVVVGCGNADMRKGADLFVQVARNVRSLCPSADIHFVWLGSFHDEKYRSWVEHDTIALGLENMVHFLGNRDNVDPYIAGADIFLMCSREDPFPLVVLAAMSNAVPIITFEGAGGTPEMIARGGGIAVPYVDATTAAHAIAELMTAPERLRALGLAAAAAFDANYAIEIFAARLIELIRHSASIAVPALPIGNGPTANELDAHAQ